MKQVAIVILNWNGRPLLEQFLPSVIQNTPAVDVIVADNGSTDDSVAFLRQHYPAVIVHLLHRNYGFAEGYNRALSELDYEYVVLLNSDVEVAPYWLSRAVAYLDEHLDVAALQPKILAYNDKTKYEYAGAAGGFIDRYGYPFCRGRLLDTVETDEGQYNNTLPVFWASGACLFIRLQDYRDAGGLDAAFFAHQEEIDLCWRLQARGRRIVCLPSSVVYHVGGATLKKASPKKDYLNFRNNLLMLYKNLPNPPYRSVMRVRFFLDYLSAIHSLLRGQWKNAAAIYRARCDFRKMKGQYRAARRENLAQTHSAAAARLLCPKSLIREYYIKGKKKFTEYGT
jgi:GT2 family glycosyltransferase